MALRLFALVLLLVLAPTRLAAAPLFQLQSNAFDAAGCSGAQAGCWTNYLRLTDLDGDGDLDVVFSNLGDFFGQGRRVQPLGVWLNDGAGHFTNQSAVVVGGLSKAVREVAIGDIDGDGDLDLYVPDAFGGVDVLLVNQGGAAFVDQAATRMPGVASHAGAARFADVDDDGDLDLLVGDGYATTATQMVHLYLNDGTGGFTPADDHLPVQAEVADPNDPAFAVDPDDFDLLDVDRDGDLDLLVNNHQGRELLWLNDGTGHFSDASANVPLPSGNPNKYNPGVCDVDGDGDLDVWIDNSAHDYLEQLLINDGQGHFTEETDMRVQGNAVGADDNGVVCADVDGDGDFDAVIVALGNAERVLINDGTGHFTALPGVFPTLAGSRLWMELGDVNGDGRLDAVTGLGESGDMIDRLSLGTSDAPIDTLPPRVGALQYSAAGALHFAVQDSVVTDEGPRLQRAFVRVTSGGAMHEVAATFMGGDLYRAALGPLQSGAMVEACAIDRAGNQTCTPAPPPPDSNLPASGGCSVTDHVADSSGFAPVLVLLLAMTFAARTRRRTR
jgi:hypothetical protein